MRKSLPSGWCSFALAGLAAAAFGQAPGVGKDAAQEPGKKPALPAAVTRGAAGVLALEEKDHPGEWP